MRLRFRIGAYSAAAALSVVFLADLVLGTQPDRRSVLTGEAIAILTLLASASIPSERMARGTVTAIGAACGVVVATAIATTAALSGVVPVHAYTALAIATAVFIPWGVVCQAMALSGLTLAVALNISLLPAGAAAPPTRELVTLLVIGLGSLHLAYLLDERERSAATERARRAEREDERAQQFAVLESRVAGRTQELRDLNATLTVAAEEQQRTTELLTLLMDSIPAYIVYFGPDKRYRWVSKSFSAAWGRSREDVIGRHLVEFTPPATLEQVDGHATRALAGHECAFELVLDMPAAGARIFEVSLVPHRSADGTVFGCFSLTSEVTERRAAEAQTRRRERLASLGTLAAGIAHEINNPAAAILVTAELVEAQLDDPMDPARLRDAIRHIASEATRCGAIVRNVLSYAAEQPQVRVPHPLGTVVEQAATLLRGEAERTSARLRLDIDGGAPAVPMNPSEILQVVLNLGMNAVRAHSKTIELKTERTPEGVALVVRDDGCGMTADEASRAFDPFFTTRRSHGGTGLGLSVVHTIVAQHGGRIDVASSPGAGTTMTVVLPLAAAEAPAA